MQWIMIGAVIPLITFVFYLYSKTRGNFLDLNPIVLLISGLVMSWGVFEYQIIILSPLAKERIFENLTDAILSSMHSSDVIFRWGGDEFVIFAPSISLLQASAFAEKLRQHIMKYVFVNEIKLTTSIGITAFQPGDTSDSLLKRADDALYLAKNNGRNCVVTIPVL
ncbi:MAG: diguanylate cyclase domain-containing protein [Anaerolineales bacterium]